MNPTSSSSSSSSPSFNFRFLERVMGPCRLLPGAADVAVEAGGSGETMGGTAVMETEGVDWMTMGSTGTGEGGCRAAAGADGGGRCA